jgi:hypothetical protein
VNYRYIIIPSEQLDPMYREFSIDHDLMIRLIELGKNDAKKVIDKYQINN